MKISAQEEYGLRCLLHLARSGPGEGQTIQDIAGAEKLSVAYVAKLLAILRQAGLIESVRGRSGGYHLSQDPAEIRLGTAMRALGEPLFEDAVYCEKHGSPETGENCVHHEGCALRAIWQTLEQGIRQLLDQFTLADLLRDEPFIVDRLRTQLGGEGAGGPTLLTLIPALKE
jgi:Rrf2 family protein